MDARRLSRRRKIDLGSASALDLHHPATWGSPAAQSALCRLLHSSAATDCTSDQLRVVMFEHGVADATRVAVTPSGTVVTLRRGLHVDARCRPVPLRVYVGVYNACNCRCSYCCAAATDSRPGLLTVAEADAIAEHLYALGAVEVRLGESGEPTQHPEFSDIVRRIKGRGLFLSLNTNGVMRDDVRDLIAHDGSIDLVIQSLDGIGGAHDRNRGDGAFAEALKTILAIAGSKHPRRPRLRFNFVVNNQTQLSLAALAALADQVGAEI